LKVAVLTTGRQDFGILRSTCHRLVKDPRFELQLLVSGMHLDRESFLDEEQLPIARRIDIAGPTPSAMAGAMVERLAAALGELTPDLLLLVGDRSETAAAALAASLSRVPIAHLHGGEETEGAIDNSLRHAITKLSHLHLVSHPDHARRIRQMGEPDDSIHVVGAPGLDNLFRDDLPSRAELADWLKCALDSPLVLVTFHPTTLGSAPDEEVRALIAAMSQVEATWVITLPNNDAGWRPIRDALVAFTTTSTRAVAVQALGERRYFGMLRACDALLGNSSSALIEAPAYALPAVNVGDRQRGRLRGVNTIDVPAEAGAIRDGLRRALDPGFRSSLAGSTSPYGDGHSAEKILEILGRYQPPRPPRKRFVDRGSA
jgi:UDP-hydrolysing UDP-N-acetyl-D-glucosamine 2-epimerase